MHHSLSPHPLRRPRPRPPPTAAPRRPAPDPRRSAIALSPRGTRSVPERWFHPSPSNTAASSSSSSTRPRPCRFRGDRRPSRRQCCPRAMGRPSQPTRTEPLPDAGMHPRPLDILKSSRPRATSARVARLPSPRAPPDLAFFLWVLARVRDALGDLRARPWVGRTLRWCLRRGEPLASATVSTATWKPCSSGFDSPCRDLDLGQRERGRSVYRDGGEAPALRLLARGGES